MKRKIVLVTDSTCDLSKKIAHNNHIVVIPLLVGFGETVYQDGVDITQKELFKYADEHDELPTTSAITPEAFEEKFKELLQEDVDIIYCGIGSKLSSTYSHAVMAKQAMGKLGEHVYVVDSKNLSTGIGLTLLKMAEWIKEGLSVEEVVNKAEDIVDKVRAQFSVKKLNYLHKGGRCSGTSKLFGTMLRVRPILRVVDGVLGVSEKEFGNYNKALENQIKDLSDNIDNIDLTNVFITHAGAPEEAKYIQEHLPEEVKAKIKNLYVTDAGCVISSHCGPNTIGILYIKNEVVTK